MNYISKKSVFCIVTSSHQADQLVAHLKTESFSNKDISVLFSNAGTGGAVTGTLSWIAGIGPLAIPGVGPFIAAGPVMAALSGVTAGAAVGDIACGLIGLGLFEIEAMGYAAKVNEGNILISVHTDDVGDIARATDIFQQAHAQTICAAGWAGKNKKSKADRPAPTPPEPAFNATHVE